MGRLGPYRVLSVLGQGGMGVVFQAEDPQLQRTVALKAMLPEVATRPAARERFLREARATAKLEHDHIVTIYQVGEDHGIPYLSMQLLKGMTLDELLRKKYGGKTGIPLPVGEVLRIGREIARGLSAAHEQGVIHRDIKPANIWLDASAGGRVKILDFGLARAAEGDARRLTTLGTIVGTPSFMAPEQARCAKLDGRADLFSLGCILYRLCAGRVPWVGGDAVEIMLAVCSEEPAPVSTLNPDLPPRLGKLVMKLLAKKPEDRPQSAKAVADAIQVIEAEEPTLAIKAPRPALPTAKVPAPAADVTVFHDGTLSTKMIRKPASKRRGLRAPLLLGVTGVVGLFAALALGLAGILYVQADTGTLQIHTADDNARVIVEQNGKQVEVVDKKTGHKATLHAGEYRLKLSEGSKDVKLDKDTIEITRNSVVAVTVKKVDGLALTRPRAPPVNPKEKIEAQPKEEPRPKEEPKPKENPSPVAEGKSITNSIQMKLAYIPAGEFQMGTRADEFERFKREPFGYAAPQEMERPEHTVKITKPFYLGVYSVTQADFQKVMGANPSFNKESPEHPVDSTNWFTAMEFCKALSALPEERKAGRVYRLPTEAEWEYACRAGTTTSTHFGDSMSSRQANFDGSHPLGKAEKGPRIGKTVKVGMYSPNAWGLHDMHGNVLNWCLDGPRVYTADQVTDPRGPDVDTNKHPARVLRGGAWREGAWRSSMRKGRDPTAYKMNFIGFRVLCEQR